MSGGEHEGSDSEQQLEGLFMHVIGKACHGLAVAFLNPLQTYQH